MYNTSDKFIDKQKNRINEVEGNTVLPIIIPRISHFQDENGNIVDINASGVNVRLKRDGTHEYWRSYGFAGVMKLNPIYVA